MPSRLRLLCFPYAGGAASAFRAWPNHLPPEIEVCAIQPPGREGRLKEAAIGALPRLVDALLKETRPYREGPFAFFGHSVGALVAFELTRALRRSGQAVPAHLFVSGACAPQTADAGPVLSALPDPELMDRLRRYEGTPDAVLAHPELMELVLPTLRADFALRDGYVCAPEAPLDVPITAFGGEADPEVDLPRLSAWREQTRARFQVRRFPGGHFFIRSACGLVLRAVAAELGSFSATYDSARMAGGQHEQ